MIETTGQAVQKSKRRAYLIKRKAKTTGFFDTGRKDDKDKGKLMNLFFYIFRLHFTYIYK